MESPSQLQLDEFFEHHLSAIKSWKEKASFFSRNNNIYIEFNNITETNISDHERTFSIVFPKQIRKTLMMLGECNINNDITFLPLVDVKPLQSKHVSNHVIFAKVSSGNYLTFDINDSTNAKIYYVDISSDKGILVAETFDALIGIVAGGQQGLSQLLANCELCQF